ncbi:chemotaxis protein [Oxalobacteraceae bacterium R-40]|uniref:Chemotaxis protein n=1 Tax=Keguizhuia sedimenti TaxID=3064264 RepID=A0ABU1BRB0_9BURK|nr:chemotaxis protein [Oxalobacteraceae bacterium R-40]
MSTIQQEVEERTKLTANNKFELMLFRLGRSPNSETSELYGINVFKLREILAMPQIHTIANSPKHVLGMANVRGQMITVIDLPGAVGCTPSRGLNILMITEYCRTTQAFAVEDVDEIIRLDWSQVRPAEGAAAGGRTITSIAQLEQRIGNSELAQVLDVEQILRNILPSEDQNIDPQKIGTTIKLPEGTFILAADDSLSARLLIEQGLQAMNLPYVIKKTGKEAWEYIQSVADDAAAEGKSAKDKIALVLTDLEMPEMDGFALTRNIKSASRFRGIPVVIHSSLSGTTNEHHVKSVGADSYVAKFKADELAVALQKALESQKRVVPA